MSVRIPSDNIGDTIPFQRENSNMSLPRSLAVMPIECETRKYNSQDDDTRNFTPERLVARVTHACKLIKPFSAILNCEIVQFFNRNHWTLLPHDWRESLMRLNVNELAVLMSAEDVESVDLPVHKIAPSLLKIRADIRTLSLSRRHVKYHRLTVIHPGTKEELHDFQRKYEAETKKLPFYRNLIAFEQNEPPLSLLKYKCKDKKLSEIVIMGDLTFKACLLGEVDFVVDIGAGLGHLSRCLAYFYGINVVAIEKETQMTKEALRLDMKFLKLLMSHARRDSRFNKMPSSTIRRITTEIKPTITVEQFRKVISEGWEGRHIGQASNKFGLVGLHPCGDLASIMLNLYKNCPSCAFINIASCCYNKMTIQEDCNNHLGNKRANVRFIGYPLSTGHYGLESMYMGRNQLGLALHGLESHQERFLHEQESFKADFYRALVEKFIADIAPEYNDVRRKNVKTMGPHSVKNFAEYLQQSIPGIVLDQRVDDALKAIDEDVEFHRILAFSALRHMFAPLLESIVLLDRVLYLKEGTIAALRVTSEWLLIFCAGFLFRFVILPCDSAV